MLKINNCTGSTVIIYSNDLSVQISPDETVELPKSLEQDSKWNIRYSNFDEMQHNVDRGFEKGGLRKRIYYKYEKQYHFPLATVLETKNISEIILKKDVLSLRKLLLFKTVYIKRILCETKQSEFLKTQHMFLKEIDKISFLKLMRIGTAITFPFAVLAILIMIGELFSGDTFMEIFTVELFLLGFIVVALEDFYYTLKARKWKITKTGDGKTG